jgi:hypothetical protein
MRVVNFFFEKLKNLSCHCGFVVRSFIASTKFKWLVFFSMSNAVICYFLFDPAIFFVRQFLGTFIFLLFFAFEQDLKVLGKEDRIIERRVIEEYPFFKYYGVSFFIFILSWWYVAVTEINFYNEPSFLLVLFYWLFFGFFTLAKIVAILSIKDLYIYYNLSYSLKLNGIRSFSTAKAIFHNGKMIGRVLFGIAAVDIGGEKALVGDFQYRSIIERKMGRILHNVDAYHTPDMKDSMWFAKNYPESLTDPSYFTKDGFMTPEGKMKMRALEEYKLYNQRYQIFDGKIDHQHHLPKFSFWESWFPKKK